MSSSNGGISGFSWFWGIVLSLSLHAAIFLLVIFWGFGTPKYSGEVESIEGRLVSPSELEKSLKGDTGPRKEEKIKAPEPQKKETKEAPQVVKTEPPKETRKEEPKKVELKKEEPLPKVKEEKPKEKDTVALETKKEKKKQVAEIPKPTEPPRVPQKKVENQKETFEDKKNKIIEEMKREEVKNKVLEDIQKEKERENVINELEQKRIAKAGPSEEGRGTRGSGNLARQSPGSRAVLASLFVNRVREEIRSNWGIPENIPMDGSLVTNISFRINEKGKISDVKVEKSSGNSAFDDFCVKAIYRTSPLRTPPPAELLEEAKTEGFEITFTNSPS
jgi:colicin import membrane protein